MSVVSIVSIALAGSYGMRNIINPNTVLIESEDLEAIEWLANNTEPTAKIGVNAKRWLRNSYRGTDGGYWISVLTKRWSILPPALYPLAYASNEAQEINTRLTNWTTISADGPELLHQISRDNGITHLYIGAKGGHLDVYRLQTMPNSQLIYQNRGIYIFELSETVPQ